MATCFCHTILEFAAAEKSLDLHGHKIVILTGAYYWKRTGCVTALDRLCDHVPTRLAASGYFRLFAAPGQLGDDALPSDEAAPRPIP